MITRILSAIVLLPIALFCIFQGGLAYVTLISIATMLMVYEWRMMTLSSHRAKQVGLNRTLWDVIGAFYILIPAVSLLVLRTMPNGYIMTLWLFFCVWGCDTGAYFTGRSIGGWKLAPRISPNKTWSGLIGGALTSALIGWVMHEGLPWSSFSTPFITAGLSFALAVVSQLGDLTESAIKRYFNLKNSGSLIPGHGGILDRTDGLLYSAPLVCATYYCLRTWYGF